MKYLGKITDPKDLVNKEYVDNETEVVQTLTSGTKIGSVGGTDLYAPSGGGSALAAYPVGSIYMSVNNTSPATLFGGTWEQLQNRFLLGAGSSYTAGDTGGSANAIIPYHRHSVSAVSDAITGGSHHHPPSNDNNFLTTTATSTNSSQYATSSSSGRYAFYASGSGMYARTANTKNETHTHNLPAHNTNYAGESGNTTGANMPPYLVVYMWKRTA